MRTGLPVDVPLSSEELQRYSRHLMLPEVGEEGQKHLKASSVLLVGAGGLGAPLGMYLAAAGVGRLGLVDFDVVDFTNLQRQVIYATADVGRRKLEATRERLHGINPHVQIDLYETRLDSSNALDILRDYDVVVDGTDNFPTRYLVNDACVLLGKPNVYGSIFRFRGEPIFILDVREPVEWQICRLDPATLIPLKELPRRVHEVPRDREVVVHCKLGGRSAKAAQLLRQLGYERVLNLKGGIMAWAQSVDPTIPRY
jgi:molybdopterin/thiamine biosynthesis adenylyltransferase